MLAERMPVPLPPEEALIQGEKEVAAVALSAPEPEPLPLG